MKVKVQYDIFCAATGKKQHGSENSEAQEHFGWI